MSSVHTRLFAALDHNERGLILNDAGEQYSDLLACGEGTAILSCIENKLDEWIEIYQRACVGGFASAKLSLNERGIAHAVKRAYTAMRAESDRLHRESL